MMSNDEPTTTDDEPTHDFSALFADACDRFGTENVTDRTRNTYEFGRDIGEIGTDTYKFEVSLSDNREARAVRTELETLGYTAFLKPDARYSAGTDDSALIVIPGPDAEPVTDDADDSEDGEDSDDYAEMSVDQLRSERRGAICGYVNDPSSENTLKYAARAHDIADELDRRGAEYADSSELIAWANGERDKPEPPSDDTDARADGGELVADGGRREPAPAFASFAERALDIYDRCEALGVPEQLVSSESRRARADGGERPTWGAARSAHDRLTDTE